MTWGSQPNLQLNIHASVASQITTQADPLPLPKPPNGNPLPNKYLNLTPRPSPKSPPPTSYTIATPARNHIKHDTHTNQNHIHQPKPHPPTLLPPSETSTMSQPPGPQASSSHSQQQQQTQTTAAPTTGSQTITHPATQPPPPQSAILRLRGAALSDGRSVQWSEDTIDNEGLGRKKSKGTLPSRYPPHLAPLLNIHLCSLLHLPPPQRRRRVQRRVFLLFFVLRLRLRFRFRWERRREA